jgi:hypothetical protein
LEAYQYGASRKIQRGGLEFYHAVTFSLSLNYEIIGGQSLTFAIDASSMLPFDILKHLHFMQEEWGKHV